MAHEIGHPAGFGDCNGCDVGDSVMSLGVGSGDYNQVMGSPTSPTQCDNQALENADYPCTQPSNCQDWDASSCTCLAYDLVDNDGGSNEDCIDYWWVEYASFDGSNWFPTGWVAYAGCFGCKSCNTF